MIFLFYTLVFITSTSAQITVSGLVKDSLSGERLIGVHVIDLKDKGGVVSDVNGYYNIKTIAPVCLMFSYIGYDSVVLNLKTLTDTIIMVNLSAG
ncbi:MAG: hypothetical protein GX587_04545, partial [Bacteroidales bacterium]|nr:hypothetical protein [Bacteroidales bacterium]